MQDRDIAVVRISEEAISTPNGHVDRKVLREIVAQIDALRGDLDAVVVTSGSIALGREAYEAEKTPDEEEDFQRMLSTLGSWHLPEVYEEQSEQGTEFVQVMTSQEDLEFTEWQEGVARKIRALLEAKTVPLVMDNLAMSSMAFENASGLSTQIAGILEAKRFLEASADHKLTPVKIDMPVPRPFGRTYQRETHRTERRDEAMEAIERTCIGGQYFETASHLAYGAYFLAPGKKDGTFYMRYICCHAVGERVMAGPWESFDSLDDGIEAFVQKFGSFLAETDAALPEGTTGTPFVSGLHADGSPCEQEQLQEVETNRQLSALLQQLRSGKATTENLIGQEEVDRRMDAACTVADELNYRFKRAKALAEEGLPEEAGQKPQVLLNSTQDAYISYELAPTDRGFAIKYRMGYLLGDRRYRETDEWQRVQSREEGLEAVLRNARALFSEEPQEDVPTFRRDLQLLAQKNMLALLQDLTIADLESRQATTGELFEHEQQIRQWKAVLRAFPDERSDIERRGREELGDDLFDHIVRELQSQHLL